MESKDKIILYHANCMDGFGSAFAAYKKFGNSASYIPVRYQEPLPADLDGKEVYIVDFSYHEPILKDLESRVKKLVVLDHHKSAETAVKSVSEHRFSSDHSGAYLSWEYFHPNTLVPRLMLLVESGDLFLSDSNTENILTYIYTGGYDFKIWEQHLADLEKPEKIKQHADTGKAYKTYRDHLVEKILESAQEVEFEGHRVCAINGIHELREFLGTALAERTGLFGIVWYQQFGHIDVSLRAAGHDKRVDLSEIAKKYGGGGHCGAAGFRLNVTAQLPWKYVDTLPEKE